MEIPTEAVVFVEEERGDLLDEVLAYQEAEAIVLDLTAVRIPPRRLGGFLAALWPALRPPVIFRASAPEVLRAAILSYPGRPGAAGDPSLAEEARKLGALWFS